MSKEVKLEEYAFDFIKDVCEKFGPRYSSSEAEKKANIWIKEEFSNYCDETHYEEFKTNPNLYPQGIFKICGILAGTSFIFIPLKFPLVLFSSILISLMLFVLITEMMLLKDGLRFFSRRKHPVMSGGALNLRERLSSGLYLKVIRILQK